jgi:hypothetical protein
MTRELFVLIALGGLYAVWVLVPLVPAVLIYKLFPSTTLTVSGPFAGLTVNASGAFAGYLIIFVGTYQPLIPPTRDIIAGFQRQFWTMKGEVKLRRTDGSDYPHSDALLGKLKVVRPLTSKFDSYQAILKLEEDDGELPTVIIEIPGFGLTPIPLRTMSQKITIDSFRRIITMNEPIIIQELPSGRATSPVPITQTRAAESSD